MKKVIKAAAAVLAAAFVLSFAACSYEAGDSSELPSAPTNPGPKSKSPKAPQVNDSGIDIPDVSSDNDEKAKGSNDSKDSKDNEDVYKVVYDGVTVSTIPESLLGIYKMIYKEGEDFTIDYTTKTITLTQSCYEKIMEEMEKDNSSDK